MKPKLRSLQIIVCACFAAFLLLGAFALPVHAMETQRPVVRVGYPMQRGLTMRDEQGVYSGYTYDYLMEISQYTGWSYEFVTPEGTLNEQLSALMEMLKNGEIDLLGAMYYDESLTEVYAYSGYCYGINYAGLFVENDSPLREGSLYNLDKLRVGVYHRRLLKNEKLEQFAQMNGLHIEQVLTDNPDDFFCMLSDGRADALLSTDLAMAERTDMTALVHYSPSPFYFTATKGNSKMIQQLDQALATIDKVNPNFSVQLYRQYFSRTEDTLTFTEQEQAFLASSDTLTVALYDNKPPFQYLDPVTGKPVGITVEVLEQIASLSGLTLRYETVSTYADYLALLKSGKADIAGDVLSHYQDAADTSTALTLPWSTLPVVRIAKDGATFSGNERVAVPYFLKNVCKKLDGLTVLFFDTVEECLQAVQRNDADVAYVGEFCSQYLFNTLAYPNLIKTHQSTIDTQNVCFGVPNTGDLNLLTIFNKCIAALPQNTVNEMIYRNTYQQQHISMWALIQDNVGAFIAVVSVLLALLLIVYFYIKFRQQKRLAFENKRYHMVSNLANEYFYEYNSVSDTLTLSDKCAEYFACDAKIPMFSKQLAKPHQQQLWGVWQLGKYIVSAQEGSREIACQMPDGSRQWFMLYSTVLASEGGKSYAVGKISSIQEMKAQQILLEEQASLDGLTGIYNIATFKKLAQNCLDELASYQPCALLILDVDSFKQVNDTFGHFSGDAVLVKCANLISAAFPDSLVGRLGGDEFVALVLCVQPEPLILQCEGLCADLCEKTDILLGSPVSWSIGASWARPEQSYEALYREADEALYTVKQDKKNGFGFYQAPV